MHIQFLTLDEIGGILSNLRKTYDPPVRGTRIVSYRKIFPPLQENGLESVTHLQPPSYRAVHLPPFRKESVCNWLTALISHLQRCLSKGGDDLEAREGLIDDAAALLAIFAGTASAGKLNRIFTFNYLPSSSIRVQVTDIPLQNQDYTTLGAQTWGGAHVLAEIIIQNPHRFGFSPEKFQSAGAGPKVLELGAGTGLVSLAVYRYLVSRRLGATIYTTDFNSVILDNLRHNISMNQSEIPGPNIDLKISCAFLDWSNPDAAGEDLSDSVDLVLGADIVYEELHASWIHGCLEKFMRKPRLGFIRPMFHLVIPLRPTHTFESNTIEGIFPLRSEASGQHGWELVVLSKDSVLCEATENEADGQVEYVYYTIGWEGKTSELEHNKS